MRLSRSLVFAFLSLFGCGAPMANDTCNATGFLCEAASSALECRAGKWVSLPCRGPNGCKREGEVVKCDMTGNAIDDACASTAEGKGLCSADSKATLECRDGKLVQTHTCRSCSVAADVVTCQP
jgi:hypothetical protein